MTDGKRMDNSFVWRASALPITDNAGGPVKLCADGLRLRRLPHSSQVSGLIRTRLCGQRLLYVGPDSSGIVDMRRLAGGFGITLRSWFFDGDFDFGQFAGVAGTTDCVLFSMNTVPIPARSSLRRSCRKIGKPLFALRRPSRACFRNAVMKIAVNTDMVDRTVNTSVL